MSRRYLRPSVLVGHVLVLAAALTCLRLGWWQWGVAHAIRGTVQNLGYALLWPVFAGAFIYMWLRFLHLESVRDAEVAGAQQGGPAEGHDLTRAGGAAGIAEPCRGAVDTTVDAAVVATAEASGPRPAAVVGADGSSGGGPHAAEPAVACGQEGGIADGTAGSAVAGTRTDAADGADDGGAESSGTPEDADELPARRRRRGRAPHEVYTVAVATVGDDDDDDPELAAYNKALAALAEQDRRRAH